MLRLQQLSATQFKNHFSEGFSFSRKVVGICGPNGIGKTNLLDAIYYLCFTKSYFAPDGALAHHGQAGFRLTGNFTLGGSDAKVVCVLRETGKKECSWNEENYPKMSRHVGRLPAVMIAPDDVELITGGSETRRRLMDGLLCQLNAAYLQQLMEYNKLLQQRNSLIKQMAESGKKQESLLEIINLQLAERAVFLAKERHQLLQAFLPQAEKHYKLIAGDKEQVSFTYQAALSFPALDKGPAAFLDLLQAAWPKDFALQRTTAGIHRDDLQLLLEGQPFKQMASQGQRKSLLFALKLTEFEWLQQHKGFAPILLLDDVFEKLDNHRMTNLLQEVCIEKQGQVFITDTHRHRLETQLQNLGADFEIIEIS
ncbi:MAG TPA: DNA replication and repair protein RecF [Phnomibacter sp.]|nr:DNA replication and repair protein RecF [Phnomibacter sp.]